MARYRQKDQTDLRWNRIRRNITRELDTQIADWREEVLNDLLADAWKEFVTAMHNGEVVDVDRDFDDQVTEALNRALGRVTA